ncbi:hypothetical protein Adt_33273 [Abeliophyllum distichum]|uniref:Uncharacterized protein n=1 Tax=Abeliophyllum distichum TaxID=126358 RepID=A0ABD1QX23_9LAMI
MADVISYRGDGAGDPPHQLPRRFDSSGESVPPSKQWGISQGINLESYFDLQGDRSRNEYRAVCAAVDRLVADRYRDYEFKAHNHLKAHGPRRPYGEMSAMDWSPSVVVVRWACYCKGGSRRTTRSRPWGWTVPNGTSLSIDLTTASKAPQGTFHQFFGDSQNDDPRFAIYEAQQRRMKREIELLKNSIPEVMPKEDENADEDLEDL